MNTTWVQFLDSDDLLGPQKMASQMALGQDRDMVYGHFMFSREDHAWPSWAMSADPVSGLAHGRTGQTTSNLFRTESVRAAGGWDESLSSAQEYDLMFRMFKAGSRFTMSEDHLTTVRLFPEGRISTSNEAKRRLNSFALRMKMWAHVQSAPGVTGAQKQRVLNALFNHPLARPVRRGACCGGYRALSEAGYSPTPDVQIQVGLSWRAGCLASTRGEMETRCTTMDAFKTMSKSAHKRVLVVSYYWPPSGGGGVQRWLKFAKLLPEFGWDPIVVTPSNPDVPVTDPSLSHDVHDGVEVWSFPVWEPTRALSALGLQGNTSRLGADQSSSPSLASKLVKWVRGNVFVPDARVGWVKPTTRKSSRGCATNLWTSSSPPAPRTACTSSGLR